MSSEDPFAMQDEIIRLLSSRRPKLTNKELAVAFLKAEGVTSGMVAAVLAEVPRKKLIGWLAFIVWEGSKPGDTPRSLVEGLFPKEQPTVT
jgi:hypothetical protein